ncbi:dienelactone hydrolase family protein [Serratia ureilytica]
MLGLYGGQDSGIPLETVETMRQAIRAANAEAEIVVYPEVGHAFNADYRPSYNAGGGGRLAAHAGVVCPARRQ